MEEYFRATLTIVDVEGHNMQIEQLEWFATLTKDWLMKVDI